MLDISALHLANLLGNDLEVLGLCSLCLECHVPLLLFCFGFLDTFCPVSSARGPIASDLLRCLRKYSCIFLSTLANGSLHTHPSLVRGLTCIYCIPRLSRVAASQHSESGCSVGACLVPRLASCRHLHLDPARTFQGPMLNKCCVAPCLSFHRPPLATSGPSSDAARPEIWRSDFHPRAGITRRPC